MKTIVATIILLCSTAHATDYFLNKGVDGWSCMDRGQSFPVSVENGSINVSVGKSASKCRAQDPYQLNQKYGLTADVSCTSLGFSVKLFEGKAVKNPIDPNDVSENTYFTIVMESSSEGGQPNQGGATKKAQPEPKKEPRIPNKW